MGFSHIARTIIETIDTPDARHLLALLDYRTSSPYGDIGYISIFV
jgi:hypothetical protein